MSGWCVTFRSKFAYANANTKYMRSGESEQINADIAQTIFVSQHSAARLWPGTLLPTEQQVEQRERRPAAKIRTTGLESVILITTQSLVGSPHRLIVRALLYRISPARGGVDSEPPRAVYLWLYASELRERASWSERIRLLRSIFF